MKTALSILPLGLLALIIWLLVRGGAPPEAVAAPAVPKVEKSAAKPVKPSVLAEYTPLAFGEVFKTPAGPHGLEYTDKIRSLSGAKVRIEGSMVRHLHDDPAVFLLAPKPILLNQREYGLADDLPPAAVHVRMQAHAGFAPAWSKEKLLVCGLLETGPKQELDGRISHLRLNAELIVAAENHEEADLLKPIASQPERVRARLAATP